MIYYDKVKFISGLQGCFKIGNQSVYFTVQRYQKQKAFNYINTCINITQKTYHLPMGEKQQTSNMRELYQFDNRYVEKCTTNMILAMKD